MSILILIGLVLQSRTFVTVHGIGVPLTLGICTRTVA